MTNTTNGRSGALAGIGFLALGLAGTAAQSGRPAFAADAKELVAHYVDDTSTILAGATMYLIGAILLLWFVSALRGRMQQSDDGLAALAYAGGVAGSTLCMAAAAADMMGALRADENGGIDPAVATTLSDVSMVLYGLAAPTAFAALVLAVGTAALRSGLLPRWLGFASIALGIALALPPISYVAVIGFTFWVGLVGGLLAFSRATSTAGSAAMVQTAAV
jgi:hypothetical protein